MISADSLRDNYLNKSLVDRLIAWIEPVIVESAQLGKEYITLRTEPYCNWASDLRNPDYLEFQKKLEELGYAVTPHFGRSDFNDCGIRVAWSWEKQG